MNKEQITQAMAQYESAHPVDTYTLPAAPDIPIWPILRNGLSFRLMATDSQAPEPKTKTTRSPKFPHTNQKQAVILTRSTRLFQKDHADYHYIADPLQETLARRGIQTQIWDLGPQSSRPRINPPIYIKTALDKQTRYKSWKQKCTPRYRPWKQPPNWFPEFSEYAETLLNKPIHWPELRASTRYILLAAEVLEKWLKQTNAAWLFIDAWYTLHGQAACLAAHHASVPCIDIQHGLQGKAHFAYSAWQKSPPNGYPTFPDKFWTWGADDADSLKQNNSPQLTTGRVYPAGNLWLNQSRQTQRQPKTNSNQKIILVTLQDQLQIEKELLPAIQKAPTSWHWLIRPHRDSAQKLEQIQNIFPTGHVQQAWQKPLYELLHNCDVHLTWFSTCAIEALAFGKPSVIIHPTGRHAFQKYINAHAMQYADQPDSIIHAIESCSEISSTKCRQTAESIFTADTDPAIDALLHGTKYEQTHTPQPAKLDLSILLATYNRAEPLRQTLQAYTQLQTSGIEFNIIIIDNNSSDPTRQVIESFKHKLPIRYLFQPKPGKNAALNLALQQAPLGQIVIFTDDDISPNPDWLKAILDISRRHPDYSIFGGKINPILPDNAPNRSAWPEIQKQLPMGLHDYATDERPYKPGHCPVGPNFWLRRPLFEKGRRFNEYLGPHPTNRINGSESSFLLKLQNEGHPILYSPKALVYHRITAAQLQSKALCKKAYQYGRGQAHTTPQKNHSKITRYLALAKAALDYALAKCTLPTDKRLLKAIHAAARVGFNREILKSTPEKQTKPHNKIATLSPDPSI